MLIVVVVPDVPDAFEVRSPKEVAFPEATTIYALLELMDVANDFIVVTLRFETFKLKVILSPGSTSKSPFDVPAPSTI